MNHGHLSTNLNNLNLIHQIYWIEYLATDVMVLSMDYLTTYL
jgi:hypothetical protein